MKHISLGGLDVSRIGLGAMTMGRRLERSSQAMLAKALRGELVVTSAP